MLRFVKEYLRARPRLYDTVRRFDLRWPPSRTFFSDFSRSRGGNVTFLQIGANDGLRNDPIREFVVRQRWSGIFVEPLPNVFQLLQENYRHVLGSKLVFVNAAISSTDGDHLSFWTFQDDFLRNLPLEERLDCLRKSSFDRTALLEHLGQRPDREALLKEVRVPCFTVGGLLEKHWDGGPIDLLVIDAEGHEPAIFAGMDFQRWSPKAIFFESHHLGPARAGVFELLAGAGYRLEELGGDTVAVRDA
jgi:FkbM family methyltransferase